VLFKKKVAGEGGQERMYESGRAVRERNAMQKRGERVVEGWCWYLGEVRWHAKLVVIVISLWLDRHFP
jgi:hypothetical protein